MGMSYLVDKEDEEAVVNESFTEFKQMYQPLIKERFGSVMEISSDGTFYIDTKSQSTQKFLLSNINDSVLKACALEDF